MKTLVVILLLYSVSVLACETCTPRPVPPPAPVVIHKEDTGQFAKGVGVGLLLACAGKIIYTGIADNQWRFCVTFDDKPAKPDEQPLAVAPDTSKLKVRLYQ